MKTTLVCLLIVLASACTFDDDMENTAPDVPDDEIPSYSYSGTLVDFEIGQPIAGQATVVVDGISPPPAIAIQGASFDIDGIPPHSVFHLLVGSPPAYHTTYAAAVSVTDASVEGGQVQVVRESYLSLLYETFDVPASGGSVLIARMVGKDGAGLAGIPADTFQIDNSTEFAGPFFLDENMAPNALLDATSASGYVVFFDLGGGLVSLNAAPGSGYSMQMAPAPTAATTVTLADVEVRIGDAPGLPQNVSFETDVMPIFELRGCASCHSGKGIGKDLGRLSLDGKPDKLYKELVEEVSENYGVTRVDLQNPEASLLLTMPAPEDPRDRHPNITFTGPSDPDYQMILGWIVEGALEN